ncbi:LytR/AlgR family response regulator transcription factor [Segetibacter aerophilus]|uniref:DNA-binding response regulator n=1 Tax=Segetibacter aerophilus TaxID=670293 RepID=A0A512BJV1_9BACT|nr:LytTR family DNA-binding domain-containing protein [Segetibacter aerophilus]GEO12236.1 DNA-binding response regulator [Segetibacter aerophilus]
MLRCIAIDDEDLALELLEDNISRVPFLQLVAKSGNPIEAIGFIQREKPDLVFLDIQMPGLTGLQVIQSLPNKPMFIFVTAYEKYALDGFKLNVVDYLVKPVSLDRFVEACNKALELHQLKNKPAEIVRDTEPAYFFINSDYSHIKLTFADIVFIEGLKDYIKIHLKSSKPIVVRLSMKSIEEQLPSSSFLRIQKSYIVAKDSITAIRKNSVFIGTTELPIGDIYKEAVYSLLGIQPQ